jgi:hypothetical protein
MHACTHARVHSGADSASGGSGSRKAVAKARSVQTCAACQRMQLTMQTHTPQPMQDTARQLAQQPAWQLHATAASAPRAAAARWPCVWRALTAQNGTPFHRHQMHAAQLHTDHRTDVHKLKTSGETGPKDSAPEHITRGRGCAAPLCTLGNNGESTWSNAQGCLFGSLLRLMQQLKVDQSSHTRSLVLVR